MWKDIPGFEGLYQTSDSGLVRALKRRVRHGDCFVTKPMHIMKLRENEKGYLKVTLSKDGKPRQFRVHVLVAMTFIPNPNGYREVNHIDENKKNNVASNLEWCSRSFNIEHSIKTGTFKITPVAQFTLDGKFVASYKSASEVERKTGIPKGHIYRCALGRYGYKSVKGYVWKRLA